MDISGDSQGIEGAAKLRVQHSTIGTKKQKRIHCNVTLHDQDGNVLSMECDDGPTRPFRREQKKLRPEGTRNTVQEFDTILKSDMMAAFRKQKREHDERQRRHRDQDSDDTGAPLPFAPAPVFTLYPCSLSSLCFVDAVVPHLQTTSRGPSAKRRGR